jgi:paraquat-inducible protein A
MSLLRVWAWLIVGLIAYVPANLMPIMVTGFLLSRRESTIVGGVIELAHHGAWGLALIVAVASIGIPVAKFVAIAYLAWSIQARVELPPHRRVRLYEAVEFIGRWSMIDVFVVAILAATVQLGFLARVEPGPAALFFALSVVATMLSAQAFDPRLLWDRAPAGAAGHR